jgi:hypothetical protein
LQLLDAANNPEAGDFMKMSCKGKKNVIAKDAMDIFGTNFGYVPEKKAPIQSILNTSDVTKKRQFGKLQKEWEERNKYVKAPANERERLEQESKWTPLQKKMAQYDKYQEVYNKIPPMWITERKDLDNKYKDFKKNIGKLWQDIADIKASNPTDDSVRRDMIDQVKSKIRGVAEQLVVNVKDPAMENKINEFINKIAEVTDKSKLDSVIESTDFYSKEKKKEDDILNYKYIKPLLEEANVESKNKDLAALKDREAELRGRIKPNDPYGNKSVQVDLAKLQGEIRKKEAEIRILEDKFGIDKDTKQIDGNKLIKTWVDSQSQLEKLGETIQQDKTIEEKRIKIESVNKELDEKLKEIVKLKKDLILAKFFAGDYFDLTKSEKESNEKKSMKDKPLEDVDTLKTNLETMITQYLEIAAKFSPYNEVQAYITLLNNDLNEVKKIKESWKKEKDDKEKEISKKIADIANVKKGSEVGPGQSVDTVALNSKLDPINKAIEVINIEINKTINPVYDNAVKKFDLYTKYTSDFKKLGQKDPELKIHYDGLKTSFKAEKEAIEKESASKMEAAQTAAPTTAQATAPTSKGGKLLRRTRKHRHQKKPSKRYILSKHKIKKRKSKSSRYRKKKYTLRRLR